jgi:SNF2 family DNA or RNA helicase
MPSLSTHSTPLPALPACPCRAGGAGITLTAGTHIILCEPTLNPSFERQAIGRSHRMGQDKPLTVTRLHMKGG